MYFLLVLNNLLLLLHFEVTLKLIDTGKDILIDVERRLLCILEINYAGIIVILDHDHLVVEVGAPPFHTEVQVLHHFFKIF